MPDFEALTEVLQKNLGVEVISADLSKPGTLSSLPWERIGVVDLSHMRGCLTSFDAYMGVLDRLHDHMRLEGYGDDEVSIIPRYDEVKWIASKAKYLSFLEEQSVPIIPTTYISCFKEPDKTTPITQPDNVKEALRNIYDFMRTSDKDKFVLKPSISSLGRGLRFIEILENNGEDSVFRVEMPREGGKSHEAIFEGTKEFKDKFLIPYFLTTTSPDHRFLLQEYIDNLETSVVYVNGDAHFVERTQGEDSHIAHARYGGQDTILTNPDPKLVKFANDVMVSLPPSVRSSLFLRVDVMKNLETGDYVLSEIEGAGAIRLWLRESNRVEDYARMLIHSAIKPHRATNDNRIARQSYPTNQDDNVDPTLQLVAE